MRCFYITTIALAMLTGGCQFIAVEDVDATPTDTASDCTDLNAEFPTGDACRAWQAIRDPETGQFTCTIGTLDADGDGAKDPSCAEDGEPLDCDEANADRFPSNTETCDGVDNDCDDVIDESTLVVGAPTTTDVAGGARSVSYAATGSGTASIALFASPMTLAEEVATVRYDNVGSGAAADLNITNAIGAPPRGLLNRGSTAVASVNSEDYVAAVIPSGCQRVVLATLGTASSARDFNIPADPHRSAGLPDADGNDCDGGMSLNARAPAVAAQGDKVLAVWGAGPLEDLDSSCSTAAAVPIIANGAIYTALTSEITPSAVSAATLGDSNDTAPPVALALGSGRFLVVFANDDDLEARTVSVSAAGAVSAVDSATYTVGGGTTIGEISAARAADGTVAVAYRQGCSSDARIFVATFSVDGSGTLSVDASDGQAIGEEIGVERFPSIAASNSPVGFTVVYVGGSLGDVRLRQTDAAGRPTGEVTLVLDPMAEVRQAPFIYALPEGGYGVTMHHASDQDGEDDVAFESIGLSCVAP